MKKVDERSDLIEIPKIQKKAEIPLLLEADIEERNNRANFNRRAAIQHFLTEYVKSRRKYPEKFNYTPSETDILTVATELIRYRTRFSYLAREHYIEFVSNNTIPKDLTHKYPSDQEPTPYDAMRYLQLVLTDKLTSFSEEWEAFMEEVFKIFTLIPPRVKDYQRQTSDILTPDHLKLIRDIAQNNDFTASEEKFDFGLEQEIDSSQGISMGIEVEQEGLTADQISLIDKLQLSGFRVEQDAEREIIFPPTQDSRLLLAIYQEMMELGYITDSEPAIHLTIGGIENPEERLLDIFAANAIFSSTGDNSFRESNPNLQPFENRIDIFGRSSKSLLQEFSYFFYSFPFRIKKNGLIEFRDLFGMKYSPESFEKGITDVDVILSQIKLDAEGQESEWPNIMSAAFERFNQALGLEDGKGIK